MLESKHAVIGKLRLGALRCKGELLLNEMANAALEVLQKTLSGPLADCLLLLKNDDTTDCPRRIGLGSILAVMEDAKEDFELALVRFNAVKN